MEHRFEKISEKKSLRTHQKQNDKKVVKQPTKNLLRSTLDDGDVTFRRATHKNTINALDFEMELELE